MLVAGWRASNSVLRTSYFCTGRLHSTVCFSTSPLSCIEKIQNKSSITSQPIREAKISRNPVLVMKIHPFSEEGHARSLSVISFNPNPPLIFVANPCLLLVVICVFEDRGRESSRQSNNIGHLQFTGVLILSEAQKHNNAGRKNVITTKRVFAEV